MFLGDAVADDKGTTRPSRRRDPNGSAPFYSPRAKRPRERILEAVLDVSGELGYEQAAVQKVLDRAQASRGTFYNHFDDKEDCFVKAYEEASEWLYRRLSTIAARQPSWRDELRVALAELLQFCANQENAAKALFIEAHAAGGDALAQHDRLMSKMAEAIDMGRADLEGDASPPPSTAAFMVGAIETLISGKLANGEAERAPGLLPGILHFVVLQYHGQEAAWEEMTSAPLATWDAQRSRVAEAS